MTIEGRVGRLALCAGSRPAVEGCARQVEIALALARWPHARPGEVVLIRRLTLGNLPERASVHALADLIGRRLVEIRPVRLRAGDPERPEAAAVVFAGRLEALAALATHVARHGAGRAWYWRRLLPSLAPSMRLPNITRHLLDEAAAPPHGRAGTAAFLRLLLEAGALDAFVNALPAGTVHGLAAVQRTRHPPWLGPAPAEAPPVGRSPDESEREVIAPRAQAVAWWRALPAAWRALLARQGSILPADDARLAWLVEMALAASFGPAASAPSATLARHLVALARQSSAHALPDKRPGPPAPAGAAGPVPGLPDQVRRADDRAPRHPPHGAPQPAALPAEAGVGPAADARLVSSWAGFWLLPAALARLRITDVASPYGPGLGAAYMRFLVARLGVPDDDPALVALPQAAPEPAGEPVFVAPAAWRVLAAPHARASPSFAVCRAGRYRLLTDRAGRLPLAATRSRHERRDLALHGPVRRRSNISAPAPHLALRAVHLALAKYLRRAAGLSLRRLVGRPGAVVATATHVDVTFPGNLIELRLRRAGLDVDPGWVPWLGRVVAYHYDLEHERFV